MNHSKLLPDQETELIANIVELVRRGVTLDGVILMDSLIKDCLGVLPTWSRLNVGTVSARF